VSDIQNTSLGQDENIKARQRWISILARSSSDELQAYWDEFSPSQNFTHLRQPETGLVMVRGRTGGNGQRFNLGEASVTRCSIHLDSGEIGHSYVKGRNKRHAELAAVFDALLQNQEWGPRLDEAMIKSIEARLNKSKKERETKVASTKVDFFTMVRGEDE